MRAVESGFVLSLPDFLEQLRASCGSALAIVDLHQKLISICDPALLPEDDRLEAEGMMAELRQALLRCRPYLRKTANTDTLALVPRSIPKPELASLLTDITDKGREFIRLWNHYLVGEYDDALGCT